MEGVVKDASFAGSEMASTAAAVWQSRLLRLTCMWLMLVKSWLSSWDLAGTCLKI